MATAAPGGMDLKSLIHSMNPTLNQEPFVWITLARTDPRLAPFLSQKLQHVEVLVQESEGYTFVVTKTLADQENYEYVFPCRRITLNVHSSLEAVGFMAAIATRLARIGTGSNPVSGYHHDHLFVAVGKEDVVMGELRKMAEEQT
ncbi:hypothetical protein LTR62_004558 [Meristemomyces frigidus]|uniref:DUF2241 domain-containing protein n=1 Tax=Meristemomyces frigidus TaxID=1508187 RepID=A0AAN7YG11_9PEZI|nr:hypothetical protein LTR62_004558 [Meristemomyces frigidus]